MEQISIIYVPYIMIQAWLLSADVFCDGFRFGFAATLGLALTLTMVITCTLVGTGGADSLVAGLRLRLATDGDFLAADICLLGACTDWPDLGLCRLAMDADLLATDFGPLGTRTNRLAMDGDLLTTDFGPLGTRTEDC